ncbi:MAG: allantoate amidohydrolase [Rubrobacter sp.]
MKDAAKVMERCDALAAISENKDGLCRLYGSSVMTEANELVSGWMREAGMSVATDALGNFTGRYEYEGNREGDGVFVLGSHLDTVRNAGRYDGVLGVLTAIECVRRFHEGGERPPFSLEVAAFADEEGTRFGTTYLGSSAYTGTFDARLLVFEDEEGVSLEQAVRDFGGNPDALMETASRTTDLVGYCEVHIEQGPVLERLSLPVGIVTGIQGQSRIRVAFEGEAGHAGTVPMEGRHDALCAAAGFVLEVEKAAFEEPGTVATVGELAVSPGSSNVIPSGVVHSLDLRHPDDDVRLRLQAMLEEKGREAALLRGCGFGWRVRQESEAVELDRRLAELLSESVAATGTEPHRLPSGAGHDAAQMARVTPTAMLFVRCAGGISHNPAESVEVEDVAVALDVLEGFVRRVARDYR